MNNKQSQPQKAATPNPSSAAADLRPEDGGGRLGRGSNIFRMLKPGASRSTHLFVAPLIWTAVGIMLMIRGWGWIGPGSARWLVLVAFGIGTAKSVFVLNKTTKRIVQRIIEMEDGTCLGAVYSWKTWLLVGLMMAFGITMRNLTEPGPIIGTLYMAIGWALFFSSRYPWGQWWKWMQRDRVAPVGSDS